MYRIISEVLYHIRLSLLLSSVILSYFSSCFILRAVWYKVKTQSIVLSIKNVSLFFGENFHVVIQMKSIPLFYK